MSMREVDENDYGGSGILTASNRYQHGRTTFVMEHQS
jgi:hypothetical protein